MGRLGWVFVSPAPPGVGANRPPLTGGQLTYGVPYGVLVDVLPPAARVRWRSLGRGRLDHPYITLTPVFDNAITRAETAADAPGAM